MRATFRTLCWVLAARNLFHGICVRLSFCTTLYLGWENLMWVATSGIFALSLFLQRNAIVMQTETAAFPNSDKNE